LNLADVFRHFEENKSFLDISEYSVSQATLEQIFIQFAKAHDHDYDHMYGVHEK
jgi:hypothetical protein